MKRGAEWNCCEAAREEDLRAALGVRHTVFVEEQGVPPQLELDGLDAACRHFVVRHQGGVIATARLRATPSNQHKLERVAVLAPFRKQGAGLALVKYVLAGLGKEEGQVVVHAQMSATPFWEKLGFRGRGESFEEAGIPHMEMWRATDASEPSP